MVDFAKADFGTTLTLTVTPTISGSNTVQLQLQPLPDFPINYKAVGSGWQQFNATMLQNIIATLSGVIELFISSTIQTMAQSELNKYKSFTVPNIPISFTGISLNLALSNLSIYTSGSDYVLITGTVNIINS